MQERGANGTQPGGGDVVWAGLLEIRPAEHTALVEGRPLALTLRELEVLSELARNPNRIITREQLHRSVWKRPWRASDRSVDVYVSRLRGKLAGAVPGTRFIHTHFGIGYRFAPEPDPGRNRAEARS